MRKTLVATTAVVLALAALAAAAGTATVLKVKADPTGLKYDKKALTAKAGSVTISMANPSVLPHNVAIKGNGIKPVLGKVVLKGGTSTVTAVLKKGAYRFYCSVPGHEAGGMWGPLIVK